MRVKRYTRPWLGALLPGLDQRLGLGLIGVHDQIPALARLAHIVGAQRKTDPLGRTAPAIQAQMTPPGAVVVPNVMVRPVFTVWQLNKFVLHRETSTMTRPAPQSNPFMTSKTHSVILMHRRHSNLKLKYHPSFLTMTTSSLV